MVSKWSSGSWSNGSNRTVWTRGQVSHKSQHCLISRRTSFLQKTHYCVPTASLWLYYCEWKSWPHCDTKNTLSTSELFTNHFTSSWHESRPDILLLNGGVSKGRQGDISDHLVISYFLTHSVVLNGKQKKYENMLELIIIGNFIIKIIVIIMLYCVKAAGECGK